MALVNQGVLAAEIRRVAVVGAHGGLAEHDARMLLRHRQQERILVERGGNDEAGAAGDQALHRLGVGPRFGIVLAAAVVGALGQVIRLGDAHMRNTAERESCHRMRFVPAPIFARADIDEASLKARGARRRDRQETGDEAGGAKRRHAFERLAPIRIETGHVFSLKLLPGEI